MGLLSAEFDAPWVEIAGVYVGGKVQWQLGRRTHLSPIDLKAPQPHATALPGRGPMQQVMQARASINPSRNVMATPLVDARSHSAMVDLLPCVAQASTGIGNTLGLARAELVDGRLQQGGKKVLPIAQPLVLNPQLGLTFEADGRILLGALILPCFPRHHHDEGEEAQPESFGFSVRVPYVADTQRVVLRRGKAEIGSYAVPKAAPDFELLQPTRPQDFDPQKPIAIRWRMISKDPVRFYLRFAADGEWRGYSGQPVKDGLDVNLVGLSGGNCQIQLVVSSGYRTSCIELPGFKLPRRAPQLTILDRGGPVVGAQAWSDELGYANDRDISWCDDGGEATMGSTIDVRTLGAGPHRLHVAACFPNGAVVEEVVGLYDGKTGLRLPDQPMGVNLRDVGHDGLTQVGLGKSLSPLVLGGLVIPKRTLGL